jgi:DNA-binding beta-propeller fold protein YncE
MTTLHFVGGQRLFSVLPRPALRKLIPALLLASLTSWLGCKSDASATRKEQAIQTPVNQLLRPEGIQVNLPGARPQTIALSPNRRLIAIGGKHSVVLIDPETGKILQETGLPSDNRHATETNVVSEAILNPDIAAQASYTGLVFSPDGSRIYLSNVQGDIKVLGVGNDLKVTPLYSIKLPPTKTARRSEIPAGLALSKDGRKLYVAGNLSNRLIEMDTESGRVLRTFDVGSLPYDVVVKGDRAYVSEWGGRTPGTGGVTGPAGQGTTVRVDPKTFIANEGAVAVVDLITGKAVKQIVTGARASGLALSPKGDFLAVANAGDDTVTIIRTDSDEACETIPVKWQRNDFLGATPNALAFNKRGDRLYVCNGTQNAIAVVYFKAAKSRLAGLIPTGWYPGAIAFDPERNSLYIANIKGKGSGKDPKPGERAEFNSHQYNGSVSLIHAPSSRNLGRMSRAVLENDKRKTMEAAMAPARPGVMPKAVPERVGEPSVFKHVIYIIKENRSYDQVLGDMKEGDGDPRLCIFGDKVTPNQHKIAREFVLLDNTLCCGVNSADGHQWTDSALASDYIEKSFAGFPRSYPYYGDDAMAYSPAGFIWDDALRHGRTLRDYGEFTLNTVEWKDGKHRGHPDFLDCYRDFIAGTDLISARSRASIQSLSPYLCTNYVGFQLKVPDISRAKLFIDELKNFEARGELPNLIILFLPNDHTTGTRPRTPTPAAKVADNDLAVGQVIEALSRGPFWKDTCVFAIEDDPQMGFDHISSYRTTAYVMSAWSRGRGTVHTLYNQTSMLRTIELILGLPPMNQFDATATPMFDCFSERPDFSPFIPVKNNVPLDQMNPDVGAIRDREQRKFAIASSKLPLDDADEAPEDLFNRILWNAQKGSGVPYPSWAVNADR